MAWLPGAAGLPVCQYRSRSWSSEIPIRSSVQEVGDRVTLNVHERITHGDHPRSFRLARIFQCLAVPWQPLKYLETLEIRVLKRLASAVQLRPWPPHFKGLKPNPGKSLSPLSAHDSGRCAQFIASPLDCRMASSIWP